MAWDPNYHGSTMMAPVVFVTWVMVVLVATLTAHLLVAGLSAHRPKIPLGSCSFSLVNLRPPDQDRAL